MYPILFQFGEVKIYAHGFFLLMALVVGVIFLIFEARRRNWPKEEWVPITLAAFVGGMIGAKASMILFHGLDVAPLVLSYQGQFDPRMGVGSILACVARSSGLEFFAAS